MLKKAAIIFFWIFASLIIGLNFGMYYSDPAVGVSSFLVSFFLGPVIVSAYVLLINGLTTLRRQPCPFCAERVLPEAKVCPFCQHDLEEGWPKPGGVPLLFPWFRG